MASRCIVRAESGKRNEKKVRRKWEGSFPKEMLADIFSRLPAPIVENSFKFISKECHEESKNPVFIKNNLTKAKAGLLIQDAKHPYEKMRHFSIEKGVFKMKKWESPLPFTGIVLANCDGLSLVFIPGDENGNIGQLRLVNLVKKCVKTIQTPEKCDLIPDYCSIGRIPATGEIKIVCPFIKPNVGVTWYILTIARGQDNAWREMNIRMDAWRFPSNQVDIVSIFGVIYWAVTKGPQDHEVYAIDLADESFHRIEVPEYTHPTRGSYNMWGRFIEMEGKFTLISQDKTPEVWEIRIYVLSDFKRSVWEPSDMFIHEDIHITYVLDRARPIAWLGDENVLICCITKDSVRECRYVPFPNGLVAYFLKTGKKRALPSVEVTELNKVTIYTSSLLWLD